jgi:lysozyme
VGDNLLQSVEQHEGCKLKAYQDSVGVWTIGYGRNLQELEIDKAQADEWLQQDIGVARNECLNHLKYFAYLGPARKDALTELMFNLGWPRFSKFVHFHAAMQARDYTTASKELLDSLWAKQVGSTRAGHMAQQIRLGDYWNAQ